MEVGFITVRSFENAKYSFSQLHWNSPLPHTLNQEFIVQTAERTCLSRRTIAAWRFSFRIETEINSSTRAQAANAVLSRLPTQFYCQGTDSNSSSLYKSGSLVFPEMLWASRYPFNSFSSLNSQSQSLFLQPKIYFENYNERWCLCQWNIVKTTHNTH